MGALTIAWLVVTCAVASDGGGGEGGGSTWLENVMQTAGVNSDDVKVYTDKLHGAIKDVHGAISNVVDKVSWDRLYKITTEKIKPKLKEGLPEAQCTLGVMIRSISSQTLLENGQIKGLKNIKTIVVRILNENVKDYDVLLRIEYADLQLEYIFTYTNIMMDLYELKKKGRLLITLKEPLYVAVTASVPKINTELSQKILRKGSCAFTVKSIAAKVEANLALDKIKYRSDFGLTKSIVSGILYRARNTLAKYMEKGMKYAVETEIRKIDLFCSSEQQPEQLDCKVVESKKLTL